MVTFTVVGKLLSIVSVLTLLFSGAESVLLGLPALVLFERMHSVPGEIISSQSTDPPAGHTFRFAPSLELSVLLGDVIVNGLGVDWVCVLHCADIIGTITPNGKLLVVYFHIPECLSIIITSLILSDFFRG